LSGGQAQRVALARAVLLLATAKARNATLVIATHDPRVAKLIPPDVARKIGL
jgi:ABC-type lipoprotein export system ATPase subunit